MNLVDLNLNTAATTLHTFHGPSNGRLPAARPTASKHWRHQLNLSFSWRPLNAREQVITQNWPTTIQHLKRDTCTCTEKIWKLEVDGKPAWKCLHPGTHPRTHRRTYGKHSAYGLMHRMSKGIKTWRSFINRWRRRQRHTMGYNDKDTEEYKTVRRPVGYVAHEYAYFKLLFMPSCSQCWVSSFCFVFVR